MPTPADQPYRRLVAALWVLVRTAGARAVEGQLGAAANDCWRCLADVLAGSPHFVLQEHGGALFANGLRIRPDVASFAATAGITALLQDNDISELLLMPEATAADFELLARCWHDPGARQGLDAALRQRGCVGIHTAHRGQSEEMPVEPVVAPPVAQAPSQLGAVFTMQRFAAALGTAGPLSGGRARAVLQAVLHRLLRSPGGLEPLARLQRDPVAHSEAVRAAVLAVRTAEELGWDDERGLLTGIAALLGKGQPEGDDVEVAELARAAQAVAALIGTRSPPDAAVQQLEQDGQLSDLVGRAMAQALAAAPR